MQCTAHAMPCHATLPSCKRCGCMRYRCRPVAHQAPTAMEPTQLYAMRTGVAHRLCNSLLGGCCGLNRQVQRQSVYRTVDSTHTPTGPHTHHHQAHLQRTLQCQSLAHDGHVLACTSHPISTYGVASAKNLLCHYPCTGTQTKTVLALRHPQPGARSLPIPLLLLLLQVAPAV